MLAGILCRRQRGAALISALVVPAALTALVVAASNFARPAFGADLDYDPYGRGPYGPSHYGAQPSPPYDHGAPAYPRRNVPPREGPYDQHSSIDQPPPYDDRAPVYSSHRDLSSREDPYGERFRYQQPPYDPGSPQRRYGVYEGPPYRYGPDGYGPHDQAAPPYPSYQRAPNGYDQAYRGNGYGPERPAEPMPPRPPAPIDGPPRGWAPDPRDFRDRGVAEAAPPYEAWPGYPPRRWH